MVLRLLHVDQRQPADRAHLKPWTGDVDDAGRDEQVDIELLELPRQVSDSASVETLGCGDRDSVAVGSSHGADDVGFIAEGRDLPPDAWDVDLRSGNWSWDTGTDDLVLGTRFAGEGLGEVAHRRSAADYQNSRDAPAVLLTYVPNHQAREVSEKKLERRCRLATRSQDIRGRSRA